MKKIIRWGVLLLCFCLVLPVTGRAATEEAAQAEAIRLKECITQMQGIQSCSALFDGNTVKAMKLPENTSLTMDHTAGIGSLYLIFDVPYGTYTVTDNATNQQKVFGESGFLHAFVDLEAAFGYAPSSITLCFSSGEARLNEFSAFTPGQVPESVQKWEAPTDGGVDMILFSTHGDDEQIYFAGLLPTYAPDHEVLVVYLTDHSRSTTLRRHEMLDGLWAVGITRYPVFGPFQDCYSKTRKQASGMHAYFGETDEMLLDFVVEQIRRYQPLVAVGHDPVNGEYGHGQHMLYADLLCRGLESAADARQFPQSAEQWGLWDVPKTYLHLWQEHPIVMDYDTPLKAFDGKTAFQVSKELGFPCHKSQSSFAPFFQGKEKATDIKEYSPCQFGLYRSLVGWDTGLGTMFENIPQDIRLETEHGQTKKTP